jgi:predicted short-subunit dehydrogenase-like oxidoreductase (DUF2520 family)
MSSRRRIDVSVESIGIIGTGRMAGTVARLLSGRGLHVTAVAGRSAEKREHLAQSVDAFPVELSDLPAYASIAVIAVSDDAIPVVAESLSSSGSSLRIALHTSGAAGPEALESLRSRGTSIGVLHPLQTVPSAAAGVAALPGSTFAYAGDKSAEEFAYRIVEVLDGSPLRIDPSRWQHYHAAAVMVSNYQAALVDAALELMEGAGVDRHTALLALRPLIEQSTGNILQSGPAAALTGPIRRGDLNTVLRHILALRKAPPEVLELYAAAGLQTVSLAERSGLPPAEAQEIAKALAHASTTP